jgi:NADH:ubiquinone oxidoreductase subunit 2 (subunit N)
MMQGFSNMNATIEIVLIMLMLSSVIVLALESIGNKPGSITQLDKPHIKLFVSVVIIALFLMVAIDLSPEPSLTKNPMFFFNNFATLFLFFNSLVAIYMGRSVQTSIKSGDSLFLLLASLTVAVLNIWSDWFLMKSIASTAWILIMTGLVVKSTRGGKRAEVALKMTFVALLMLILSFLAFYLLEGTMLLTNLSEANFSSYEHPKLALLGIMLFMLSGMCLAGIPPFSFAHLDCADSSNLSVSFLMLSNAMLQGASHLLVAQGIMLRSGAYFIQHVEIIGFILALGLLIACLRALDQSSIRRTISYLALSISPLFCLSFLFGTSALIPKLLFLLAIFIFSSIALMALFGAMSYMDPLSSPRKTWEDISGLGRQNKLPALYLLIALASIVGLPGTLGYFVKLSLIAPMKENYMFNLAIFASIALGAACVMRVFVFLF